VIFRSRLVLSSFAMEASPSERAASVAANTASIVGEGLVVLAGVDLSAIKSSTLVEMARSCRVRSAVSEVHSRTRAYDLSATEIACDVMSWLERDASRMVCKSSLIVVIDVERPTERDR